MVHDRKEPTFSTASKTASANSSSKINASIQANPTQANPTKPAPNKVAPRPRANARPQVMIQKQPSALLWLVLLIALLASAVCGYLFWILPRPESRNAGPHRSIEI